MPPESDGRKAPLFSVVIPTRNRPDLLREAVDSVKAQTLGDWELIVVDDASTPGVEIPRDDKVRVLQLATRRGPGGARNAGVTAARGRYVAFLDDDDLFTEDRLEIVRLALGRAPIVVCGARFVGECERSNRVLSGDVSDTILDGLTPSPGATTVDRARFIPFDESMFGVEDVDWWLRIAALAPVTTVPAVGYLVRRRDRSESDPLPVRVKENRALLDTHHAYFRSHPRAWAFRLKRIGLMSMAISDRDGARRAFRAVAAHSAEPQDGLAPRSFVLASAEPMTGHRRTSPVVVLGFDAMAPALVHAMVDAGRLPNFAALLDKGATAAVRTPPGVLVGGVWPSLWTGRWPSQHGFYCFRQLETGTYRIRRFTPDDVVEPPFWMTLDDAERRTCVLDVPLVSQTRPDHGIHITDWGTHDRMLDFHAWPTTVESEVQELVGNHSVVGRCDDYTERGRWSELLGDLRHGIEQRTELSMLLLARGEWDCFATVFSEAHCAGHQFWWAHDRSHPSYSEDANDPLEQVYEALDDALGRLLGAMPPDATVMVVLSHGIGTHHDADHLLVEILRRLDDAYGSPHPWLIGRERLLNTIDRRRAPRQFTQGRAHAPQSVDSSRRFFKIPNNEYDGAVRINLQGTRTSRTGRARRCARGPAHMVGAASSSTCENPSPVGNSCATFGERRRSILERESTLFPTSSLAGIATAPLTVAASDTIGVVRGEYTGYAER